MALNGRAPNEIEFTQYLRPNGRRRQAFIARPEDVVRMARLLEARGCAFDIEALSTGDISMTVEYDDETLARRVCANGPDVPPHVDVLIREAYTLLFPTRASTAHREAQ